MTQINKRTTLGPSLNNHLKPKPRGWSGFCVTVFVMHAISLLKSSALLKHSERSDSLHGLLIIIIQVFNWTYLDSLSCDDVRYALSNGGWVINCLSVMLGINIHSNSIVLKLNRLCVAFMGEEIKIER